jgi:MraZ protein
VFTGNQERQLDPKGRLALPADFRRPLGEQCKLTFGQQGRCIDVFTAEAFEAMAQGVKEKVDAGELPRDALRVVMVNTFTVPIDKQGRILVDKRLRDHAGLDLGSRVVVAGVYDRIEIWNTDLFNEMNARGTAAITGS